jgi:peroxiredoxin
MSRWRQGAEMKGYGKCVWLLVVVLGLGAAESAVAGAPIQQIAAPYPAPPLRLMNLDDKLVRLSDFRGRTVIINFWATWCPPCRRELPSMQRTYARLKDKGLEILAVNVGEEWEVIAPFISPYNLEFPILLDPDSSQLTQWQAIGLPTSFLVDEKGMVTHRFTGGRDWDDPDFSRVLEKIIDGR